MSTEATTGRPAHANDTTFDSLADLFLGDDPHREPTHRAIETRGLIVGHLPVLASAWVAQHARDLAAERNAPVAVVSRAGGRVTIDLHGVAGSVGCWPAETRFIAPSFPINSIGMLDLNSIAIGASPAFGLQAEHPTGREYASHLKRKIGRAHV